MKQKAHFSFVVTLILVTTVLSAQPVCAGGGITLYPPFDGTYRVTAYFDHESPNYGDDDYIWIYNGEQAPANSQNDTPCCTGDPYPYDGHDGWDWSMYKEDVLAAADGVVEFVGWYYGLTIALDHSNNYYTYYSHLNAVQPGISQGTSVEAGQLVGGSGDTGAEGSYHLHFGVRHGADWNSTAYATDPFGWRGSDSDPLLDFGQGHTASCLWAGVPGDDISCSDIIVEDDGAGWEENSGWTECHRGNGYRQHWLSVQSPLDSQAYWEPWYPQYGQLQHSGYYQIRAFIPADHSTTSSAHYRVHYNARYTSNKYVNQGNASNSWISLGTYLLWPGSSIDYVSVLESGSASGEMAADSMKFSASIVYLPDVRNWSSWISSIIIWNNSTSSGRFAIHYYNTSGGEVAGSPVEGLVFGNASVAQTPLDGFAGPAVVVANPDVSVVVENRKAGETTNYNGIAAADPLNSGWGQVGTAIYAPAVKYKLYGRTSRLYVMNAGSSTATITPTFHAQDNYGSPTTCTSFTVLPQGRYVYDPVQCAPYTGRLYGVELVSTQPLAVVVVEQNDSGAALAATSNAFSVGATPNFVPLVKNDFYGNQSSIVVQNVGSGNANIGVTYYDRDSTSTWSDSTTGLEPLSTHVFPAQSAMPSGKIGSARVTANQPLASTVYEYRISGDWRMQHSGFLMRGSETVILPRVYKNYDSDDITWRTGFQVQNVGTGTAHVTVRYYDTSGSTNSNWNQTATITNIWRAVTFNTNNSNLPEGFVGSAVVTADQDIVVQVNVSNTGSGDGGMSYNGVNR